jgi:putative flippase GtrA
VLGTAFGAISGAVVHFLAGRYWAFASRERHIASQGLRYALVAVGSFFLNVGGVYCLTELALFHYLASKFIVAISVGIGFNFTMHRLFVFK